MAERVKIEASFNQSGVAVLLALFDGASALQKQLSSIADQTYPVDTLIVSDDGSTDESLSILEQFAADEPRIRHVVFYGPRSGFAQNFMHLLRNVGPESSFAALCDQDDVWLPEKIERSVAALADVPADVPALYCSRTIICDAELQSCRLSPLFNRAPCFEHSLVQNIAGGNTMVLNRAALDIVQAASREARAIVAHDWWLYQIISGVGGQIIYDPEPTVYYRQHDGNAIGAQDTLPSIFRRVRRVWAGRYRQWNTTNVRALRNSAHRLTPENKRKLATFSSARRRALLPRLLLLRRSGAFRQTKRENLALWLAAVMGRV